MTCSQSYSYIFSALTRPTRRGTMIICINSGKERWDGAGSHLAKRTATFTAAALPPPSSALPPLRHPSLARSSLTPAIWHRIGVAREGEGRERVLAPSTPSTTAIPKLWPPYSDKSGGRTQSQTGRKEGDGRDPEAGGKRHKKPEPAGLSDQAPSIPAAPPTFVRGNGSHHPRCSRAARHSCFPPSRSLSTSQSPQSVPTNEVAELGNRF